MFFDTKAVPIIRIINKKRVGEHPDFKESLLYPTAR